MKSCCCCDLRGGSTASGCYTLLCSLFWICTFASYLTTRYEMSEDLPPHQINRIFNGAIRYESAAQPSNSHNSTNNKSIDEGYVRGIRGYAEIGFVFYSLVLLSSVLLLIGIGTRVGGLLLPWIIFMFVITTFKIIGVIFFFICIITYQPSLNLLVAMLLHIPMISLNCYCIKCVMDHHKEIQRPELYTTVISSPLQSTAIKTTTYQLHVAPPKLMTLNMETECLKHALLDDPHNFESIIEPPPYKQQKRL